MGKIGNWKSEVPNQERLPDMYYIHAHFPQLSIYNLELGNPDVLEN